MTDIIKTNSDLSVSGYTDDLSPSVNEIIIALSSTLVAAALPPEIFNAIKVGVAKSYADTGFSIHGTEKEQQQSQEYLILEIMRYVRKMHHGLRINEIPIAFSRGIRKQYGDFMGLSVISFCNFIDGYVKDKDRQTALFEKNKLAVEKDRIPTYDEIFDTAKGNALRALADVKALKEVGLYAGVVHDFLETLGLIILKDEDIKAYRSQARELTVAEYAEKNTRELDKFKRIDNQTIINALMKLEGTNQDKVKHLISYKAKSLALTDFLRSVILDKIELSEVIESKREKQDENEAEALNGNT